MEVETATKIIYGALAVAFSAQGVYKVYRATTGIEEDVWVGVGFLILGLVGWILLFVRFD